MQALNLSSTLAYCAPHDFKYGPLIMSRDIIWPGMASFQTGLNRPMYIHYSHESGQTYVICSTERVFPKSGRPSYTRVLYLKESYMQDLWMPLCDSGLFAAARFVPVNSTLVKLPAPSWIKEQLMSLQVMLYENKDGMRDAICEEVEHEIWWEEENASTYESGHATGKKGSDSSSTAGKGSRRRAN